VGRSPVHLTFARALCIRGGFDISAESIRDYLSRARNARAVPPRGRFSWAGDVVRDLQGKIVLDA
jgi:hypothetical protein